VTKHPDKEVMIECKAFDSNRCKSCDLIKLPYDDGLNLKIKKVVKLFDSSNILDPIKSIKIKEYRNKAKFIIGGDLDSPIIGIPSPANIKDVSPLTDCPLHSNEINKLAELILNNIQSFVLTPYDLISKKGEFKYLIISEGHQTGELSIRFGMRSMESFERVNKLHKYLTSNNPNIKVCSFEVQSKHAAIFDGEEKVLTNNKYIQHNFENIELSSSTSNFFQVNAAVANKLYETVFNRFKDEKINKAVDLFCGVGGFAQQISRFSKMVYGIEINQVAIECANYSVQKNGIQNIKFICDDANNFQSHVDGDIDLLVVNPPRRGIGYDLCKIIAKINPKYVVYSSCNAKTLASDIDTLKTRYKIESITPVDMFPLTNHLEVLCFLIRV
jgi:23S rRNA (uracil747-C5)-methyltransferase